MIQAQSAFKISHHKTVRNDSVKTHSIFVTDHRVKKAMLAQSRKVSQRKIILFCALQNRPSFVLSFRPMREILIQAQRAFKISHHKTVRNDSVKTHSIFVTDHRVKKSMRAQSRKVSQRKIILFCALQNQPSFVLSFRPTGEILIQAQRAFKISHHKTVRNDMVKTNLFLSISCYVPC